MFLKLKNLFLSFSILFLLVGVTFFFAHNWNSLKNYEKLSLPLILILFGIVGWFFFQKKEKYRQLCLLSSSFFIGILFISFSQIYQTGANSYILFRNWGFFIIIFSLVENFYPIWTLNISIFTISIMLYAEFFYHEAVLILFSGSTFLLLCSIGYVILIKKLSLPFKAWFYNLISFLSLTFSTFSICSALFSYKFKFYDNLIVGSFYIITMLIFLFLNNKYINRQEVKIFQITSLAFVISSFIINNVIKLNFYSTEMIIFSIFFIICIFLITLSIIVKKYRTSPFTIIFTNFFKIFLIILIILFFLGLSSLLNLKEFGLYLGGSLLILFANFLPKYLNFKRETIEITTFIAGLILIFVGIMETVTSNKLIGILIIWTIYVFFWIIKKSMTLDFLAVPTLIFGLYTSSIISNKFESIIIIIPLLLLLISIIYEYPSSYKLKRILRGTEITSMLSIFLAYSNAKINIGIYITDLLIMIISLIIFYKILNKKNINLLISLGVIILLLEFFVLNSNFSTLGFINLGIMFILLYIFKDNKRMLIISILFLTGQFIDYYYNLDVTLIKKSYMLLESSALLFLGYILLKRTKLEVE
ncbi:DUF4401 domain-containing protein [Fusobacterium sp. MFO224]|uniref:DUF4401 domain-containing protein n=1 Tax=Fusobacterium sp. MFO224 TaxID=3378070 RepID=UPI003852C679